jgi:hypothetical protein
MIYHRWRSADITACDMRGYLNLSRILNPRSGYAFVDQKSMKLPSKLSPNQLTTESYNERTPKQLTTESYNEWSPKQLTTERYNELSPKQLTAGSYNERTPKQLTTEGYTESLQAKQTKDECV